MGVVIWANRVLTWSCDNFFGSGRPCRRKWLGLTGLIVSACRSSLVDAGRAHGIIWVDAASAGRVRVSRNGAVAAPIEARLTYERAGSVRTKQSLLICHLSPQGTVIALR